MPNHVVRLFLLISVGPVERLLRGLMRHGHDLICATCSAAFFICSSCYRCHKYCSRSCRKIGYSAKQKVTRKKYASTPEARADHCDRNKIYRVYGRQPPTMMDETSDEDPDDLGFTQLSPDCCAVCGTRGTNENLELFSIASD